MTTARRVVVVGFGSIGRRHARVLSDLGCDVAVVSRRAVDHAPVFSGLEEALEVHEPEYVVIASRTSEHFDDLDRLAALGFDDAVLCEKPLYANLPSRRPNYPFRDLRVGYNLRFHPCVEMLGRLLSTREILTASIYVGQYLPTWRPHEDYRSSYSSRADQGGGALLDLSHDIDYALSMLGACRRVTALGGKLSRLEIDSDDAFSLLLANERCPVTSINVNYLDRVGRREMLLNCQGDTITMDLIANEVRIDDEVYFAESAPRDTTYTLMHQAFLDGESERLCGYQEATEVLQVVEGARTSARLASWVTL